jgi:hypothetical protein
MAVPYLPAGYTPSYGIQYGMPQSYMTGIGIPGTVTSPSQGNQNGLIIAWVQGIAAMKSFSMGPNQKAFLFNTEENNFGIKSTDANGMPYPLEIFRYERDNTEVRPTQTQQMPPTIDTSAFVTREELETRIASILRSFENNQIQQNNTNNRQNNQNQNRSDQKHGK